HHFGDTARGQTRWSGLHQGAKDRQANGMGQGGQRRESVFCFHVSIIFELSKYINLFFPGWQTLRQGRAEPAGWLPIQRFSRQEAIMPAGSNPKREREFRKLHQRFKRERRYPGRETEVAARIV